jgi:hypothetical protein
MYNVWSLCRRLDLPRRLASSVGPILIAGTFHFILEAKARRELRIEMELFNRTIERSMIFQRAMMEDRTITEEELNRILRPYSFSHDR